MLCSARQHLPACLHVWKPCKRWGPLTLPAAPAQNKRGGRVKLHALVGTQSEFDHAEKGDALYAFELALCA